MDLPDEELEIIAEIVQNALKKHGREREKLIPILQDVQLKMGYLPTLAMEGVAKETKIPAVDVFGLATFYNQFRLNPPGKHQIKVCMGTACYMTGGHIAMESFMRHLDIGEGETTSDRLFSLERVACVGCCSLAPVVVVDHNIEAKVTPTRVDGIMLSYIKEREGCKCNGVNDNQTHSHTNKEKEKDTALSLSETKDIANEKGEKN